MLNTDLVQTITKENFKYDKGDCTNDTFTVYISLPAEIQKHYQYLLPNSDGTESEHKYIETLLIEYWIDENTFHYIFTFEDESIGVSKDFNCDYMNNLVLEIYKERFEN